MGAWAVTEAALLGWWGEGEGHGQAHEGGAVGELAFVDQLAQVGHWHPLDPSRLRGVGRLALVGGAVGLIQGETKVADPGHGEVAGKLGERPGGPAGLL